VTFRVLMLLAVICAFAAVVLFFLQAFSTVIAVALAVVFGLGALAARVILRAPAADV
jgi:hypothetical protein